MLTTMLLSTKCLWMLQAPTTWLPISPHGTRISTCSSLHPLRQMRPQFLCSGLMVIGRKHNLSRFSCKKVQMFCISADAQLCPWPSKSFTCSNQSLMFQRQTHMICLSLRHHPLHCPITSFNQTAPPARKMDLLSSLLSSVRLHVPSLAIRTLAVETDPMLGQDALFWAVDHGREIATSTATRKEMDLM